MNFRITNGSVSFGAETILEEINFEVKGKQKVAIVGRNGAGKSTLLKSIIDNEMLSEGIGEEKFNIYKEGNPKIGYLKQIDFEDDSITMIDEVLKVYKEIIDIENKIEKLVIKMQSGSDEEDAKEYARLQDRYELLDGYTYKKEYETAINKFGFSKEDRLKKLSEFSGGQRTKIAFIKLLLSKPDILLLDEPTNHLDITTIEWLETYLKNYPKAVVIVSHDRMFINKIVDKVFEIEYGTVTEYSGDYEFFEKQKRINYERQLKDYEFQQKEIKRLTQIADRFRYKPTKAKWALSKLKQVERMVKLEEPNRYDLKSFNTNFEFKKESGNNVLAVNDLQIGYDEKVLSKINFNLYKGEKLGIVGPNGTGKSTLLKTIVGNINRLGGTFELGHNVQIGYFDQQMAQLNSDKTVFDEFYDTFPDLTVTQVRNALASFLFYGEDVFKKINMLSGGEKVRLALCKILKEGPNLLILDEPTNHMDIIGKESLENMLKEYKGTLIFVSHDRFFVKKIASKILAFKEENEVQFYDCDYEEYLNKKQVEDEEKELRLQEEKLANSLNKTKTKKTYLNPLKDKDKLEKKIKKLEESISNKEEEIDKLKEELTKEEVYVDYVKVNDIQSRIDELNTQIEEDMNLWESLQEDLEEVSKLI